MQDKLGKQDFHEDTKNLFEPFTDTIKNTSRDLSKSITETAIENKKAIENLMDKLLEKMSDRGIQASSLFSPLPKIINLEITSQILAIKVPGGIFFIRLPKSPVILVSASGASSSHKIFIIRS